MNRFERITEHVNVNTSDVLNDSGHRHADVSPEFQVDLLMAEVVDRVGLHVRNEMPSVAENSQSNTVLSLLPPLDPVVCGTGLDEKLAKLRNDHNDHYGP